MEGSYGRVASVGFLTEDLPMEHNQVTLDPDLTDSDGIPAPKITYIQDENNKKMMAHGRDRAVEALDADSALLTSLESAVRAYLRSSDDAGANPWDEESDDGSASFADETPARSSSASS